MAVYVKMSAIQQISWRDREPGNMVNGKGVATKRMMVIQKKQGSTPSNQLQARCKTAPKLLYARSAYPVSVTVKV